MNAFEEKDLATAGLVIALWAHIVFVALLATLALPVALLLSLFAGSSGD